MSGSGGRGGPYYGEQGVGDRLKETKGEFVASFSSKLEDLLNRKLANINERNTELMNDRRQEIKEVLADTLEEAVDLPYGGSVAKHTYVDGISDIDSILIIRSPDENPKPSEIKRIVSEALEDGLSKVEVTSGKMAVTLKYSEGMEIQLIPAIRHQTGYRVPSWTEDEWSRINPEKFKRELTNGNDQCNGKLIPTIKLAKAIIATWPEQVRLSGYHVESMALDIFRGYEGVRDVARMLPRFFEKAAQATQVPVKDISGQSGYVDNYLGPRRSEARKKVGHWCLQTSKKMEEASIQGSEYKWRDLFE